MRKVLLGSLVLLVMWTGAARADAMDEIHEREGKMCLVHAMERLPRRAEVVGSSVWFFKDEKPLVRTTKSDRQRRYEGKIGVEMGGQKIGYIFGCSVLATGDLPNVASVVWGNGFIMQVAQ
ncbi:hypothetical protein [Magnetospirillum sp. 15-1]|uniref:hypothetical protein n=1 Tax=Magnetospirillum sp. 15-1 TaxID=1979370 RepID=UPI000BBCC876|nr:hypothetical protein [Magnetospirillum sp. 15-1]